MIAARHCGRMGMGMGMGVEVGRAGRVGSVGHEAVEVDGQEEVAHFRGGVRRAGQVCPFAPAQSTPDTPHPSWARPMVRVGGWWWWWVLVAVGVCFAVAEERRYLIRSGYMGIHRCELPGCVNDTVLVPGYQGQAPYSFAVQVDDPRNAMYWGLNQAIFAQPDFQLDGARLDSGKALDPSQPAWKWIQRQSQDRILAFDRDTGTLYVQDSKNVVYSIDPETKAFTLVGYLNSSMVAGFVRRGVLYVGGFNPCGWPTVCTCLYSMRLDDEPPVSVTTLACAPDVPLPQQAVVLAGSDDALLVTDPNDDFALVLDYSGKLLGKVDLSNLGANVFVQSLTIDERSHLLYVCGSLRSQTYTVAISVVDLQTGASKLLFQSGMDTCGGMQITNQPRLPVVPHVMSIRPTSGPLRGQGTLHVTGTRFKDTESLVCRFGTAVDTAAVFIDTRTVACSIPPSPVAGEAVVQVSLDGVNFSTEQVFYTYKV